jgi:hypothetical protein
MPITAPTVGLYPSIAQVNASVRVHVNESFTAAANGTRVYTDTYPVNETVPILNIALQSLQRDLENYGLPSTREVVFIVNGITPVNGPMGLGIPDPTVQVYLSFNGYWDGGVLHVSPVLPPDLLVPIEIKQRITNSGTVFTNVPNSPTDLPSVYQNYLLGWWTWRQDAIWFNGSQNTCDIELRYTGGCPQYSESLSPDLFSTTLIPFLDCMEALSYKMAYIFASPRLPNGEAEKLDARYEKAMLKMANRYIKSQQWSHFSRRPFGDGRGDLIGSGWG